MTTIAVKRHFRNYARARVVVPWQRPPLAARVPTDADRALLDWLKQVKTIDPILLAVRSLVDDGGTPSSFEWRVLRRAYVESENSRLMARYVDTRQRRQASLSRQRAAVAARATTRHGGKVEESTKELQA